jgi:hypothetical protein
MDTFCRVLLSVDWRFVATIGIPAILVVVGWFFVHRLNAQRDLLIRRREARLKALEAAYIRIATSSNRPQLTEEMMEKIETFVSEIQLYGTPHQIQLMTKIVEEFKKSNNIVSFDALLADLRDTIRKELKLESVSGPIWWLRLNRVSGGKMATTPLSPGPPTGSGGTVS